MLIFAKMCVNLHPNLNSNRLMRQIKTLIILLSVICLTTSCLTGSSNDVTYYADAAITSFSLGTLNRNVASTTSDGRDTVVATTITGSNYAFHIDQVTHEIYNTDSLPVGTDVNHVPVYLTTKNNGLALIQSIEDADSLIYYSSADSIDFTQPRIIWVLSSDGTGTSKYTVHVNVHSEKPTFYWEEESAASYPTKQLPDVPMEGIKQILGESSKEIYALSNDNKLMVRQKDGSTWEEDLLDESSALLPTQDLSLTSFYYDEVAENTDYVILVGNRSVENYPQEPVAMVWRKIVDNSPYAPKGRWTYMGQMRDERYALPRLEHLQVAEYDDRILAIGGKGLGGCTATPYSCIYESRDYGITWKKSSLCTIPAMKELSAEHPSVNMLSDGWYLWLQGQTTGEVWRGLLNTLLWKYE